MRVQVDMFFFANRFCIIRIVASSFVSRAQKSLCYLGVRAAVEDAGEERQFSDSVPSAAPVNQSRKISDIAHLKISEQPVVIDRRTTHGKAIVEVRRTEESVYRLS